jgi:hypothetical protein
MGHESGWLGSDVNIAAMRIPYEDEAELEMLYKAFDYMILDALLQYSVICHDKVECDKLSHGNRNHSSLGFYVCLPMTSTGAYHTCRRPLLSLDSCCLQIPALCQYSRDQTHIDSFCSIIIHFALVLRPRHSYEPRSLPVLSIVIADILLELQLLWARSWDSYSQARGSPPPQSKLDCPVYSAGSPATTLWR